MERIRDDESIQQTCSFNTTIRFEEYQQSLPLNDAIWNVVEQGEERVRLAVDVHSPADAPLARVTKTYELPRQPADQSPDQRTYDLILSVEVENLTDQPMAVIITQKGPVGLTREDLRTEDRMVIGAEWEDGEVSTDTYKRAAILKQKKIEMGKDDGEQRIAWASESNKYFTCIMAPAGRRSGTDEPRFAALEAITYTEAAEGAEQDLSLQYVSRPIVIPAGAARGVGFDCYIGPKSKRAFQGVAGYAERDYYQVITVGFMSCAPGGLVALMMRLLNTFHAIWPHNYGVAIIVLVLVVRTILHPITKKSQANMMRMQKNTARLQPKIQAVREKHANDRAAMNQAIMEVYKEEGINPAGQMLSCLPMMLQIPIWMALWTALSSTIEMRHAPFDGWWIKDLAGQDALISFGRPITIPLLSYLMGGPMDSLNLLPILLGISQVLQTRFMPKGNPGTASNANPDQLAQQRKMMMFMSVFFVFILYNAPSGLNLYIMSSNFFGILEQWRIRQHLAEEDKKSEDLKPAPIPPTPGRPTDGIRAKGPADPHPKPKGWLQKRWGELQKQVEDAKRVPSSRPKSKPRK
jgi:YidC/Oxa1 family membrane protein insertase